MTMREGYANVRANRVGPLRWRLGGRIIRELMVLLFLAAAGQAAAAEGPDWDQVANIKDAATRLAQMQRARGATKTFEFIDACYKTHSLSTNYTKAFEACIAQDYMETQVLALIYSRLPPETLKKIGAPTPKMLAETMGERITAAFASYNVPAKRVEAFKKLVDEQGFPVFFEALFPGVKVPDVKSGPAPEDKTPEDKSGPAPKDKSDKK